MDTAKFLKLEEDGDLARTTGVSVTVDEVFVEGGVCVDGSHGTYFYFAPEIKQHLPKINEKAVIYSLGILFFKLWRLFTTRMERTIVLSDLIKGDLPLGWADEFPNQASLLHRMISSSPSIRPSATQLFELTFSQRLDSKSLNARGKDGAAPTPTTIPCRHASILLMAR